MRSRWTTRVISSAWSTTSMIASPSAALAASTTPSSDAIFGTWEANWTAILALYGAFAADLPLQLQNSVDQRLGGRRASRDIDVDRHDAVASADHRIAIVI